MTDLHSLLEEGQQSLSLTHGVLRCVIATAETGGALDSAGVGSVTRVLQAVGDGQSTPIIGSALLVSEGRSFCTGGNVRAFDTAHDRRVQLTEKARLFHDFILALVRAPIPVVAAVHGWAVGAGMSIVCACDAVVGARTTKLRPAYPSIGFSTDGGLSWSLPRLVGPIRARDLLLTDGVVDGDEAARLGLITRLVSPERIVPEAELLAQELAQGPTSTLARLKRLTWESAERSFPEHLHHEAQSIGESAASPAGVEGIAAFVEQRPPNFSATTDDAVNARQS